LYETVSEKMSEGSILFCERLIFGERNNAPVKAKRKNRNMAS